MYWITDRLNCTYVLLMLQHGYNKETLALHVVALLDVSLGTQWKLGVRAVCTCWYLKCRWGHNEVGCKSRLYLLVPKVSLGTQRKLCSGAQEQRSRRAEMGTRLCRMVTWLYLGSWALLKGRLAPGQAMILKTKRSRGVILAFWLGKARESWTEVPCATCCVTRTKELQCKLANGNFRTCSPDAKCKWKNTSLQTVGRGLPKIQ